MPASSTLQRLLPRADEQSLQELHFQVFEYAFAFVNDERTLSLALLFDPRKLHINKEGQNTEFLPFIEIFNKLNLCDKNILTDNSDAVKNVKIIWLSIYKCLSDLYHNQEIHHELFTKKRVRYALKILEQTDISAIREDLEDVFFAFLEPNIYQNYTALREFSLQAYERQEAQIWADLNQALLENGLEGEISTRIKSVFSIHKKIIKKNILYSQVLDIIGIRITVKETLECYRVMEILLKKWPLMNNKIKDYIAVPKLNNYQSIHLTILYHGHPVEIQIRTEAMHLQAQYGSASHLLYKNQHSKA